MKTARTLMRQLPHSNKPATERLAEGSSSVSGMPRACPVEAHDSSYTRGGPTPPFSASPARLRRRGRSGGGGSRPRVCVARNVRIPRTSRRHSPVAARTTANCWRNITEKLFRAICTPAGGRPFRDRDHAFQEAVETPFTVRPNCARKRPSRCFVRESCRYCGRRRLRAGTSSLSVACFKIGGYRGKSSARIRLKWTEPSLISFWNPEHDRCGHQYQERLSRLRSASAAPAHVS